MGTLFHLKARSMIQCPRCWTPSQKMQGLIFGKDSASALLEANRSDDVITVSSSQALLGSPPREM